MAVSNVTRRTLIYAAEEPGKAGAWTSVTTGGGTLTLDTSTATHEDTDTLRCLYESAETPPVARGGNLWPIDLGTCALASGNSRTADYGDGPVPGSRSTLLTLAGDNAGANTGALTLAGRTDGAMFGMRVWLKGSGAVELRLRAVGASSGVTETVASLVIASVPATWTCYLVRGYCAQFDCSSIQGEIRANGSGGTVEAYGSDLRLLENATDFPEYQPPNGAAQTIYVTKRVSVSVAAWGDSMTAGSAGGEWRTELQRLLLGAPLYNGGVGGETSTQIKDRFIASTDAAKTYRSYGVQIIWAGQNNTAATDTILTDIETMLATLKHGRFLILPPLNSSTYGPGSGIFPYVQDLYKKLRSRYGTRFCDIMMPLRAGYEFTRDAYMYDTTHLNGVGLGIVANEIYKAIRRNGWMDTAADPFNPVEDTHPVIGYASIAAAVANTELLPAGKRHGFLVVNDSASASMYLALGTYASGSTFFRKLAPGEAYEMIGKQYHGAVSAQWSAAVGYARVTEIA